MDVQDTKTRILTAYKLLSEETTTQEKFESVRMLIKGIHPRIDAHLEKISQALSDYKKFQKGEIIELTAEKLPENTEEEKRKKKALLLFIRNWKSLQSEVERVRQEFEKNQQGQDKITITNKILAGAKGPFGIVTICAVVIVAGFTIFSRKEMKQIAPATVVSQTEMKKTIKIIEFDGKQIPLSELEVRSGPDCDSPHYHAKNHVSATALDGTVVPDPGACAFGKEKDVRVIEIDEAVKSR